MALTAADIEEFISLVQQDAGLRERVRRALIDGDFERISESLAQIAALQAESKVFEGEMRTFRSESKVFEGEMRSFEADMRQFQADSKGFEGEMRSFEADVRQFQADSKGFEGEMRSFEADMRQFKSETEKRFNRIDGELGNVRGELFESRFGRNYGQMLGRRFRNIRPLVLSDFQPVQDLVEQSKISDDQWDELSRADALMLARERGASTDNDVVAVIEISRVVDRDDVERARRRSAILSSAGVASVACAVGEAVTEGALTAAGTDVAIFAYRRDPIAPVAS